ncbi:MAG: hypothetical protein ABEH38_01490 [Flavobacteriales bacterium]
MIRSCSVIMLFLLLLFHASLKGQGGIGPQKDRDSDSLVNPQAPIWVMKTNPFRVVWGPVPFTAEYRMQFETVQGRFQTMQAGVSYLGESPVLALLVNRANPQTPKGFRSFDIQVRGARLQFTYKFYLGKLFPHLDPERSLSTYAPNGYYVAPYFSLSYAQFRVNHSIPFVKMTHTNANIIFGRQMFYWDSIALDVYGGVGVKSNEWVQRNPVNHNASIVDPSQMGLYKGKYRVFFGADLGFFF